MDDNKISYLSFFAHLFVANANLHKFFMLLDILRHENTSYWLCLKAQVYE